MKYEAVFGDQSLFDGAPEDVVIAIKDVLSTKKVYYFSKNGWIKNNNGRRLDCDVHQIAMRRIIKEPKQWTWEDKKAGRFPDVGAELIHKTKGICYFVGVGLVENACWALKLQSGLIYIAEKSWCSPIESPEEKARRERDEWAKKASQFIDDELDCVNLVGEHVMRRFYNAMLSGDLPVPIAPEKNK